MNKVETAAYIGRSSTWFTTQLGTLYASGFPRPLPLLDSWDRFAVDRWLDRLGGEVPLREHDEHDAWMTAAHG